jgi:hypothetical protein
MGDHARPRASRDAPRAPHVRRLEFPNVVPIERDCVGIGSLPRLGDYEKESMRAELDKPGNQRQAWCCHYDPR